MVKINDVFELNDFIKRMITDSIVPKFSCLNCKVALDGITHRGDDRRPRIGDASICWKCGDIAIFESVAPPRLRQLTDEEIIKMAGHEEIVKTQKLRTTSLKIMELTTPKEKKK